MQTADFDYPLPAELVAQRPTPQRDASRLLVLDRASKKVEHRLFHSLPLCLQSGDLLVLNNSRVLRARLWGRRNPAGARFELLLLEEISRNNWWSLLRPAKRAPVGSSILLLDPNGGLTGIEARVMEKLPDGTRRIEFLGTPDILPELDRLGEIPLPPYIGRAGNPSAADAERYQTVYAREPGSVAAPTAGLHFTPELLRELGSRGVETAEVTLHVGLGTFAPVKTDNPADHPMHEERFVVSDGAAAAVSRAKASGRRVVAVGTTSLRVLESAAPAGGPSIQAGEGRTRIFIHPPGRFQIVDALITNFHLPRTTLLMLVSAFADPGGTAGLGLILDTYAEAVRERYRFYSYGDAMLIQ